LGAIYCVYNVILMLFKTLQVLTECWLYNKCMLHQQQAPAILAINASNLWTVSCGGIKALVRPHSILTLFPIQPDSEETATRYRNPWSSGKVPLQCTYTRLLLLEGQSETVKTVVKVWNLTKNSQNCLLKVWNLISKESDCQEIQLLVQSRLSNVKRRWKTQRESPAEI
jgi:hypothetical protein